MFPLFIQKDIKSKRERKEQKRETEKRKCKIMIYEEYIN